MTPRRIAILTHSTLPRGGVAHALSLGEALADRGHAVTVFAPDAAGGGFSRSVRCETRPFPVAAVNGNLLNFVRRRVNDYVDYLQPIAHAFDLFHAHDGISGNALATLQGRGLIGPFVRTVHHLDDFADAELSRLQDRSILAAGELICVSDLWKTIVHDRYDRRATTIFNGVDLKRFGPDPLAVDAALRSRLALGPGPIFLSIGGIEARKNSLLILQAFARYHADHRLARLVIAGGASLLDHTAYRRQFDAAFAEMEADVRAAVSLIGIVSDEELPALMRCADALVFPSIKEGFGLVVLEAMACGTPVVVSHIAPFTEYLAADDCAWCDPRDPASIAAAMSAAVTYRDCFRQRGMARAAGFSWSTAAARHEVVFNTLLEKRHASNAI